MALRVLVNTIVVALLTSSAYAVVMVVKRSREPAGQIGLWRRNEITFVMSFISLIFPMIFEVLGLLEQYHPRKQLRIQLARIMVLNLLNLYSLIFAQFDEISTMTVRLEEYKRNMTEMKEKSTTQAPTTIQPFYNKTNCHQVCTDLVLTDVPLSGPAVIAGVAYNIALVLYPKLQEMLVDKSTTIPPPANYYDRTTKETNVQTSTEYIDFNYSDYNPSNTTIDSITFNNSYDNSSIQYNLTGSYDEYVEDKEPPELKLEELANVFGDYLSFILFNIDNESNNVTDLILYNETSNFTHENSTIQTINNTDAFEYFKSTIVPFLNLTSTESDGRFDTTLITLFQEITSTVNTFPDNFTIAPEKNCTIICGTEHAQPDHVYQEAQKTNYTARRDLRKLCWETMFGQELVKLTVMDLIFTILSTMGMDFIRGIFVRYMNRCWCWDLEKKFPQYGDFKVAENILHLVNNQGMVWMGMFFSPGLVVLNSVKLYVMMYFRAWIVLSCNVPHEIIFRASRSNNFYYALLLMMLFLCVLPVGYAIVWIKPSWHCGPFSEYDKIFIIFTKTIKRALPDFEKVLDYIASPGTVIPLLVLLILIIYYLVSLTASLREANNDLKIQLRRERTEERRKMFQIADRRRRGVSGGSGDNPYAKWKTLLERLPSGKSLDETPRPESEENQQLSKEEKVENHKTKDFFTKLMKKALGKSSTSEDDNHNVDDATDTEQHESLPEDLVSIQETKPQVHKPLKPSLSSGSSDFQKAITSALAAKRNQKRLENLRSSTESSEAKHVQIQTKLPRHTSASSSYKRKDFEHRRPQAKCPSGEPASASRQDSGSSLWSDNIPVIKISKTDSAENILDVSPPLEIKQRKSSDDRTTEETKSPSLKSDADSSKSVTPSPTKFKPKIKYALKKQSSEIDEDMIFHFNRDVEGAIYSGVGVNVSNGDSPPQPVPSAPLYEHIMIDKSSSDDTEAKDISQDTILNAPLTMKELRETSGQSTEALDSKKPTIDSSISVDTQRSFATDGSSTQTESSSAYKDITLN